MKGGTAGSFNIPEVNLFKLRFIGYFSYVLWQRPGFDRTDAGWGPNIFISGSCSFPGWAPKLELGHQGMVGFRKLNPTY